MDKEEAVFSFFASLPTATYLRLSGDGGGRLQLDFDDKQLGEVLKVVLHRGVLLEVTVRPVRGEYEGRTGTLG